MIHLYDHYFDFEKMEAYRNVDYQNFNVRRKDCLIKIEYDAGIIWRFSDGTWFPWTKPSNLGFQRKCEVTEAYRQWIDNEIDRIVL